MRIHIYYIYYACTYFIINYYGIDIELVQLIQIGGR